MATSAFALKEEGNKAFKAGDFKTAEDLYSKAYVNFLLQYNQNSKVFCSIQRDSLNPALFTNRAFSRIKLQSWDACIDDSIKAIELQPGSMKGYYYLAQAQIALHHPNEALNSALTAYDICIRTHDSSATNISNLILQAKKEKWEVKERDRLRRRSDLLKELEDSLSKAADAQTREIDQKMKYLELDPAEAQEEKAEIQVSLRRKTDELRSTFAIADPTNMTRRLLLQEVPDYLIDNISFAIMHDPVVTRTGNSYDRSTLLEHLKRSNTDPLTREPLTRDDLRPNLALKQACAEFLEENGWAVDW
ncbi:hypothetical protein MMC19_005207 [Ptychographa xylographoides]|nr:hypothetical protein [Ptychographa xylographoides]